jgi:hypothetical protein
VALQLEEHMKHVYKKLFLESQIGDKRGTEVIVYFYWQEENFVIYNAGCTLPGDFIHNEKSCHKSEKKVKECYSGSSEALQL